MADSAAKKEKKSLRKSNNLKRRSERNLSFDLNRSSPQVREKYKKNNKSDRMASKSPQIEDRSATITVSTEGHGAVPKTRGHQSYYHSSQNDVSPTVRSMVTESVLGIKASIDRTMSEQINEKIGLEMKRVHDSISQLSEAVRNLSLRDRPHYHGNEHISSNVNRGRQVNFDQAQRFDFPPPALNPYQDGWRIRVDKFGLEFKGSQGGRDQLSVEEFIFRLEHMQRQYRIPWEEILRDFHLLVSGTVQQWYWALLQTTVITDWSTLRLA